MKRLIKHLLRRIGFEIVRCRPQAQAAAPALPDVSARVREIIAKVRPFSLTSEERLATLVSAVTHVTANQIPGDIAECGVWRGGSMMAVALTLLAQSDRSRSLYLYDTYEGMSEPTEHDRSLDGASAAAQLQQQERGTGLWCYAGIEDVRANILSTGYPEDKIHFVQGKVEETLPRVLPGALALLRLDTDWYESTRHELTHLYPLLQPAGALIIDDYGHWQGVRKAVDEYFEEKGIRAYLHRIDYSGRIMIKPG